jgi:type VI protein secretion system component VasF
VGFFGLLLLLTQQSGKQSTLSGEGEQTESTKKKQKKTQLFFWVCFSVLLFAVCMTFSGFK